MCLDASATSRQALRLILRSNLCVGHSPIRVAAVQVMLSSQPDVTQKLLMFGEPLPVICAMLMQLRLILKLEREIA